MRSIAIAAGVVALAVGIGGGSLSTITLGRLNSVEQSQEALVAELSRQVTQQQTALAVMSAPDTESIRLDGYGLAANATAYYYWSKSASMGVLVCSNLPTPPAGQEYEMWIDRGTRTENAGKLTVEANETTVALVQLSGSEPFNGMDVTLTPGTARVLVTTSYR